EDCDFSPPSRRLQEALDRWDNVPNLRNLRCYLDTHIVRLDRPDYGHPVRRYLDPVPFLRLVLEVAARTPQERPAILPALSRADLIPALQRGPAHGDFHGRNIFVGVMQDQVHWPAVFDYGDMGRNNYVGMDFVKLETELKVRAYPRVFADLNKEEYTRAVHD